MKSKLGVLLVIVAALVNIYGICGDPKPLMPPPEPPPPDTVAVEEPPPPPPPPPPPLELVTIHFDLDKYNLTAEATEILAQNAQGLEMADYASVVIRIEGHCDERGSDEYNMALGEKRAATARDYLINYGIAPDRISIISYGESRPLDMDHNEEAWSKNRRGMFIKVSE
ncbi:MAG: peptidoglycan-associated lipoprotein Pal [candidate division Zixibacteria bacterium]|nr:peptidoglycan-associated lipoprotein Pal [candidate division Zixibacteria bacterium]